MGDCDDGSPQHHYVRSLNMLSPSGGRTRPAF